MKKASKVLLTVTAAALVAAAAALFLVIKPRDAGVEEQGPDTLTLQGRSISDEDSPDMPEYGDAAISDSALPPARMPVLRIGAKEDPDVYLQSLDIRVEVTGNIASTRYTMVFKNNTNRMLEGELTFPLPDGRTATHYALDIDGKMRDAVPVEKARATQVFEEIQQREVDPGVLERVEGNNFRTRIYPFPRYGTRTISIGYEEELTLENGLLYYRLPMAYPNPLEKFAVKATVLSTGRKPLVPGSADELRFDRVDDNYVASFAGENYRPSRALVFALPAPVNIPQVIMQSAQGSYYFLASIAPKQETRKKQWSDELAIIWDVSLSGSQRNLEHEIKMLDIIFADKKNANVHLYFLNNRFKKIVNKNSANGEYKVANGDWGELKKVLEAAVFDGGTDFSQINLKDVTGDEILFFSDGLSTLSDADFLKGSGRQAAVPAKNRPIHCVVSSSSADYSAMKLIAGTTKGKFVNISALSYEKLKDELLNETLQFLGVSHGKSVREVYPSIAAPVQGNFSVAGISSSGDAELTLLFGFGDKVERRTVVKLDARKARRQGNVYRIWAQKKIEEFDLDFDKNRAELTELGKQFGIVTRNTSLIVLETMDDYIRFSIEPPASEPEMRARYHNQRRGREKDMRDTERDMMASAVSTAQSIRKWWNTKYELPDEPKYPVPDENDWYAGGGASSRGSRSKKAEISSDFFEKLPEERTARLTNNEESEGRGSQTAGVRQNNGDGTNRKGVAGTAYSYGSGFGSGDGGGGDPRARATAQGVLGTVSGQTEGKSAASADVFGKGGFATDIDAILSGVGGLKSGDGGGTERKGIGDIGYGSGYGSGFGSSGGGIDDLLGGLMGGSDGGLDLRRRGELRISSPEFLKAGSVTGVRSRASIQRVVMQNMAALRHAYSRRLREKPNLEGTITVRFAIDASGRVILAQMISSTINDSELENTVVNRVRSWHFEKLEKLDDVTEVTYPFTFSQNGAAARIGPAPERERTSPEQLRELAERNEAERQRESALRNTPVYLRGLTGKTDDDYQAYLKLRNDHLNSPKFYFDMAGWFYQHNDKETALRVLTSIAELELENASLYRMLGYRFKEWGEYTLQKFVCRKVMEWRPMEPQSYRDYALALADNGETQAALDSLYGLLTKSYSTHIGNRSSGIDEVVITEINRLLAKNPRLSASKIDRRLRMNTPADIRVVLNWNMNNINVDLSVVDPTGEECLYGSHSSAVTNIGGRLSADNRSGYGPEQFILKKAPKGKYQVYASYRGAREFAAAGPVTVMAEIYTKYGTKDEQRVVTTLQLTREQGAWDRWGRLGRWNGGQVLVGEFVF